MNIFWKIKLKIFNILYKKYTKDIKSYLKLSFKFGLKNQDFSPKRCIKCANTTFYKKAVDSIEGVGVCEYESYCKKCRTLNGYWSYGYWMPF